jgi:putative membrane protein
MTATVLIAAIAALHAYILVLEMFLWTSPRARRAFGTTEDFARQTRVMAANQGLYNGFLAAGLVWALVAGPQGAGFGPALFFLCCVLVAGLYGAATASRRILFVQAVPAALALGALFLLP